MHFYWRIQQDLNCLGEMIRFNDPAIIRSFTKWAGRKSFCLALLEDFSGLLEIEPSRN